MGYVPRRSDASAHQRGRERRERSSGQERHSGKAAKNHSYFQTMLEQRRTRCFCGVVHIKLRCAGQRTQCAVPCELSPNHEQSSGTAKTIGVPCEQRYTGGNSIGWPSMIKQRSAANRCCHSAHPLYHRTNPKKERNCKYEQKQGGKLPQRSEILHHPGGHDLRTQSG